MKSAKKETNKPATAHWACKKTKRKELTLTGENRIKEKEERTGLVGR